MFVSPVIHAWSVMVSGNPAQGCKFEPTCSVYCEEAIHQHGVVLGLMKSIKRICRCHPFSSAKGYDPV